MNTTCPLAFGLLVFFTAGCANSSRELRQEPYVKPAMIMLTADQAAQRGIQVKAVQEKTEPLPHDLQPLDASAVTVPQGIKVYTVNRAVDPSDPELMHEEHVVYRRETSAAWRLEGPTGEKILVGPRMTDGRRELQPLMDKELIAYLSDQRRATEANQKAITSILHAIDALNRQQETLIRRSLGRSEAPDSSELKSDAVPAPIHPDGMKQTDPAGDGQSRGETSDKKL